MWSWAGIELASPNYPVGRLMMSMGKEFFSVVFPSTVTARGNEF